MLCFKAYVSDGKDFIMLDGRFVQFVETNDEEGETFVTFVKVNDDNREILERFIRLGERADFLYDEITIEVADPRINEDSVELLSLYDTNSYMAGFVVSELDDAVVSRLDKFESIEDSEELGEVLGEAFYKREGFVSRR